MDLATLALLTSAATVAGFIDAIAGGGGLITLPALLLAGVPPAQAIATNKLQGTFGVAAASYRFWRAGEIGFKLLKEAVVATAAGAAIAVTLGAPEPAAGSNTLVRMVRSTVALPGKSRSTSTFSA